jgi:hypothetical protein
MHCEVSKNDIPAEFRAQCQNPACPEYMKLFRAAQVSAVQLEEIVELRGVKG